jgi:hypothetical protein
VLPSSVLYKPSLLGPHKLAVRVRVYQNDVLVADTKTGGLPLPDGAVDASMTARVTRTFAGNFPDESFTGDPLDVLSPYLSVLRIEAGIEYATGLTEVFPIFKGRVTQADRLEDGTTAVQGDDLAADVIGFQFEVPQNSITTHSTVAEIQRLILQALPSATFGVSDVPSTRVPVLTWDQDRGQALDDLAAAVSGRWYALGDGDFVVRLYPYTIGAPVATMTDGPGGMIAGARISITRQGAYNSVTVVSERMDGLPPIRALARNNTVGSPTRFGNGYGRVSQIIRIQTPLTQLGAGALAKAQLAASGALSEQWATTIVPDYTLEPSDVVDLTSRRRTSRQVIDRISYPLTTQALMTLSSRSRVDPPTTTGG